MTTSTTAIESRLLEIEEIINSCLFVVESTGTGPYVHDIKPGYHNLDTGYHVRLYYLPGVCLSPHELKLIDKRLSKIGLIVDYISASGDNPQVDSEGPYDKIFLHLHLRQLSESPSPETCGCFACSVERNEN